MPVVVVHGVDASITSLGAPTYQQIHDALQSIQLLAASGADLGGWVGPRPRVVRIINTGAPRAWLVHFAWPYGWPDGIGVDAARTQAQLLDAVRRQLAPSSSDWTVSLDPYSAAVNGPIADWQSGALSVTQTADQWPTAGGRLDAQENPIGPTTPGTHPGTIAGAVGGAMASLTEFLKAAWPILGVGVGLYVANSLGAFDKRPKKRAKKPPPANLEPLETWDPFRLPAGARSNPDYSNPRPAEWMQYAPDTLRSAERKARKR